MLKKRTKLKTNCNVNNDLSFLNLYQLATMKTCVTCILTLTILLLENFFAMFDHFSFIN